MPKTMIITLKDLIQCYKEGKTLLQFAKEKNANYESLLSVVKMYKKELDKEGVEFPVGRPSQKKRVIIDRRNRTERRKNNKKVKIERRKNERRDEQERRKKS